MDNHKKKIWSITAGVILGIAIVATIGLFVMVVQLDMFPEKYLVIAGLVVVFLLALIGLCCFGWPFGKKKETEEMVQEKAHGKNAKIAKYLLRTVGVLLAFTLVTVDVMGMSMVYELQQAISNVVGKDDEDTESEIKNESESQTENSTQESTTESTQEIPVDKPFVITEDPFLIYISGTDTRGSGLDNQRNDVNILAAVNPKTKQVLLINTPRDYYVKISISKSGQRDKLTHCGNYGIDCSIDTLENLYNQEITYYTQINFKGFKRLIDAVGGVEIYSSRSFYTTEGNYKIKKGMNLLDGEMALAYVRDRFSYNNGEAVRAQNQMDVIKALIKKMSSGILLTKYADILDSMGKYFRCSLNEKEISSLVKMQLGDMAQWEVNSFAVTGTGSKDYTYSMPNQKAYVMIPDEGSVEYAHMLIDKIFAGEELSKEDLEYDREKLSVKEDVSETKTEMESEIEVEIKSKNEKDTEIESEVETEIEQESKNEIEVEIELLEEVTIEDRN